MFDVLGRLISRFPWLVLAFWLAVIVLTVPVAARVGERLSAESEVPASSESGKVASLIEEEFPGRDSEQLILAIRSKGPHVGDTDFEEAVEEALDAADSVPQVVNITSYRDEGLEEVLSSTGGEEAAILIGIKADGSAEAQRAADEIRTALAGVEKPESMEFLLTGNPAVELDTLELSDQDVVRAETTVLPLTLLMLVVAFGALVAAVLPIAVAVTTIVISSGALFLVTEVSTVSVFAQSVVTLLALALGIDYALLMVNRFREELALGKEKREAAAVTVATAGRTVMFSGGTVAISLAALLILPVNLIRSIGIAGLIVVLVAVAVAVTAMPAMLALLGERANAPRFLHRFTGWTRSEEVWGMLARFVTRRPVLCALGSTLPLLALALPLSNVVVYNPGEKGLGTEAESRRGVEVLNDLGLGGTLDTLNVLVDLGPDEKLYDSTVIEAVHRLTEGLEGLGGVKAVSSPTSPGSREIPLSLLEQYYASQETVQKSPLQTQAESTVGGDGRYVLLQVIPETRLSYDEVKPFVEKVESEARTSMPEDSEVLIGGSPVENLDYAHSIYSSLPLVVTAVFCATFVLLLIAFRSLFVPLLSLVTNTLTVGAALGLLVLVFQGGYGSSLLGLSRGGLGTLEEIVPITVFAITFGLSMDYQVFLLSRVREGYVMGRGIEGSISRGLVSTGRVISFAALIMLVVFGAFLLSELVAVSSLGFGLATAVFLDVTLVRLLLVPALLQLFGKGSWWLPSWLGSVLADSRPGLSPGADLDNGGRP